MKRRIRKRGSPVPETKFMLSFCGKETLTFDT